MKILITGAGGFIGSNLCNLLSQEHKILAVSRKFDNIIDNKNIQFVKYDLTQYVDLNNKFASFLPDIVIHCAWEGGNSSKDVNEIWQSNNIISSNILLKLCSKFKIKHFIGFGTSAEYGDFREKFNEESICKPINMYGISKFAFRLISERYCLDNGIDYSWVIPVFTYGPSDVETRLIPKVIKAFLNNENLVLNSCSPIINYLYIEDFCKAIKNIIDLRLTGNYIISSNEEYQVKGIVQQLYNIIKPKSNLFFDSSLEDKSPQFVCGSSEKIKRITNWNPEISLEKGLMNTINYFKK